MKTNKLMTAVALSAMFAACTQDAELNETLAKNDFSNIPMVEADFTAETGVDSRMANGFGWEEGDLIGLAWGGQNGDGQAWANYPLKCINPSTKAFKGESMYYIGKYFGYLPYSEATTSVGFIPFSIKEQPLTTDPNDLSNKVIYITPHTIELTADNAGRGKNFALKMAQLANCATINLTFKNTTADLKVKKVELDIQDEQFKSMIPVEFTYKPADANGNPEKWADVPFSNFCGGYMNNATLGVVTLADKNGLALNSDSKLTVYAVTMPAYVGNPAFKKVSIKVTTTMGTVEVFDAKVLNDKGEAEAITASTPLVSTLGQKGTIEATIDMKDAMDVDKEAKDQAELETIIANWIAMGHAKDPLEVTLKPESANDDTTFELTDFVVPEGLEGVLTLKVDGTNAKTIVFNGETTIDKNIKVMAPSLVTGTMTVKENVVWDNNGAYAVLTIGNGGKLINNGYLNAEVKTAAATDDEVAGKYVHNGEKAGVAAPIDNQGEAQWMAGASAAPSVVANTNFVYAEVLSYEEIEAAEKAKVYELHVMDGAYIGNNCEDAIINFSWIVKCYGKVTFHVTDTNRSNTPTIMQIVTSNSSYSQMIVAEGANVTITSNNQKNEFVGGYNVTVEKNASLYVNNVTYGSTVIENEGYMSVTNVKGMNNLQ